MKRILDFSHADARKFFLKEESYCNFDLPKYFVFQKLLEQISQEIQEGTSKNTNLIENSHEIPMVLAPSDSR